jgi:hypothetical protein
MTVATERTWHYLGTLLRDVARDVLAGTITIKDASQKYDLPVEWIESKIVDPVYEPPKTQAASATLAGVRNPPTPRSVLTAEEKKLKDSFIDPLQKRRLHVNLVVGLGQAATEVQSKQLTIEAAADKYDVAVSEIQKRIKDPVYEPAKPLPPNHRPDPRREREKEDKKRGGLFGLFGE